MNDLFVQLNSAPIFLYIVVVFFGLTIGSFLNVVIFRLPKMLEAEWKAQCEDFMQDGAASAPAAEPEKKLSLSYPGSNCPNCGHKIRAWENIPVISYLVLGGKCSACKTRISIRYPIIELATALLAVYVISQFELSWMGLAAVTFTWVLLTLSMIDFDTQLLPDRLTLPLMWLGLIVNTQGMFTSLEEAVWGAIGGYLSLWSVYHLFRILTGKEGMGYGDFKLLAAMGAWLGWKMLLMIVLLSSLVGAVIGIALILILGRDKNVPIPFGPYLAIAGWIAMMWGDGLMDAYFGVAGFR